MLADLDVALEQDDAIGDDNTEVALTWLESFLESATPADPEMAGLRRVFHPLNTPKAGKATWVCQDCARIIENKTKCTIVRSTMI